jgi:DNA sulfur modification protein DndC
MEPAFGSITTNQDKVFTIFDESIREGSTITLAYSGGKDSTVLAILLYRWAKERRISGLNVTLLHNDTLSEIDMMEKWARKFMRDFRRKMSELGNHTTLKVAVPKAIDTFYWRTIIRGYPAMTRNFRWCVKLLKMQPTMNSISDMGPQTIMTGLREFESRERAKLVKQKFGGCPLGPSKCLAYYFLAKDDGRDRKVAPLRDWPNSDIWEFMRKVEDYDISDLLYLYGCDEARYGCWHCTLARVQWGLHALKKEYLYFDALRLLYRRISDLPNLRFKKNSGYSKLGALDATGRSMLLHLMQIAEAKSGIRIYGLDEVTINGYSLRRIFYDLQPREAQRLISQADPDLNPTRAVGITELRDISKHASKVQVAARKIAKTTMKDKSRVLALEKGFDPTKELLDELLTRI